MTKKLKKSDLTSGMGLSSKGFITMTVKGFLAPSDNYSRYYGDAYELAEMHASGVGSLPKRNFMENAKRMIMHDQSIRDALAKKIKASTKYYKRTKQFVVNWEHVGTWLASKIRSLLKSGKLGLAPLMPKTVKDKKRYGYGRSPLYASGGLAECITYKVG